MFCQAMVQAFHLWHGAAPLYHDSPHLSSTAIHLNPALPEQKPQHPAAGLKRDISLCFQLESFSEVFLCFLWIKSSSPCLAFELQHCVLTIYLLFPVCCVIVSMSACWKQVGRTRSTLRSRMELVKGTSHTVESCAECFFFEIWPV